MYNLKDFVYDCIYIYIYLFWVITGKGREFEIYIIQCLISAVRSFVTQIKTVKLDEHWFRKKISMTCLLDSIPLIFWLLELSIC